MDQTRCVAIVGTACRFPGGDTIGEFWQSLLKGQNYSVEIPPDRWNVDSFYMADKDAVGKTYARHAALLQDIRCFDNKVFNITEEEARFMDVQQKLVLEVTYKALEDAGISTNEIAGSDTSVFLGMAQCFVTLSVESITLGVKYVMEDILNVNCYDDQRQVVAVCPLALHVNSCLNWLKVNRSQVDSSSQMNDDYKVAMHIDEITTYSSTGAARSILANRVSFQFDLRGPSATIDTACSSSLLCVHLGLQSILSGESTMSVCGGVNVLLSPSSLVGLAKAGMASAKGQCSAFADKGDGYLKGEGCGIVILKKLDQAVRDGDKIWCIVTTAANQDGGTVSPITTPSSEQQKALIERLYIQASVKPENIQYIEAHGTGTKTGDPIEAKALGETIGAARKRAEKGRCPVGSVKTNIGHLESAAGIAGLIKIILMQKHRKFVPSLHFDAPNPSIDFDALNLSVTTQVLDFPVKNDVPDILCVNSFGFGGTNVHAVIQGFSSQLGNNSTNGTQSSRLWPVTFSAASPQALLATVKHTHDAIEQDAEAAFTLQQLAYTSAVRRTHFRYRLGLLVGSTRELKDALGKRVAIQSNKMEPVSRNLRVVFAFGGMGTTFAGMGSELSRQEPVFANSLREIDAMIRKSTGWSVIEKIASEQEMTSPEFSQPALFAVQMSLYRLLSSWGIHPDAILGHSVGEVAASCAAGILHLEDCVQVICNRGKFMAKVSGGSMMVAEKFPPGVVEGAVNAFPGRICVAAINATNCFTLSGDSDALEQLEHKLKALQTEGTQLLKKLSVNTAFHSHHVDPVLDELRLSLKSVKESNANTRKTSVVYSTVTGQLAKEGDLQSPEYWVKNARGSVFFEKAFKQCMQDDKQANRTIVVEVGPRPALGRYMRDSAAELGMKPVVLLSMKPPAEHKELCTTLTTLYEVGLDPNWKNVFKGHETDLCRLPEYQYQKKDLWHDLIMFQENRLDRSKTASERSSHCFIKKLSDDEIAYIVQFNKPETTFVSEHKLANVITVPGAMYLEMGISCVLHTTGFKSDVVTISVSFDRLFTLSNSSDETKELKINVYSRDPSSQNQIGNSCASFDYEITSNNIVCASGYATSTDLCAWPSPIDLRELSSRCPGLIDQKSFYDQLARMNFSYGRLFRSVQWCRFSDDECLGEITVCDETYQQFPNSTLHPCLGDAILQLSSVFARSSDSLSKQPVPRCIRQVKVFRSAEKTMLAHMTRRQTSDSRNLIYDAVLVNAFGEVYAQITGFTISAADIEVPCNAVECMYSVVWSANETIEKTASVEAAISLLTNKPPSPQLAPDTTDILVFSDNAGIARRVVTEIKRQGFVNVVAEFLPAGQQFVTSMHRDFNHITQSLKKPLQSYKYILYCWPMDSVISESMTSEEVLSVVTNACFSLCQIVKCLNSAGISTPIFVFARQICELLHSADPEVSCPESERQNMLRGVVGHAVFSLVRTVSLEPGCPCLKCIDLTRCDDAEIVTTVEAMCNDDTGFEISIFRGRIWRPELMPTPCQSTKRYMKYSTKLPYRLVKTKSQQIVYQPNTSRPSFPTSLSRVRCLKVRIESLPLLHTVTEHPSGVDEISVIAADSLVLEKNTKMHLLGPSIVGNELLVDARRCVPFALFPVEFPVLSLVYLAWYITEHSSIICEFKKLHRRVNFMSYGKSSDVQAIKSLLNDLVLKRKNASTNKLSLSVVIFQANDSQEITKVLRQNQSEETHFIVLTNRQSIDMCIEQPLTVHEVLHVPSLFDVDINAARFEKFKNWLKENGSFVRESLGGSELRFQAEIVAVGETPTHHTLATSQLSADDDKLHILDMSTLKDSVPVTMSTKTMFRSTCRYIIVGGSRGLGWELIKHMAKVGAKNIISWSRQKPDEALLAETKRIEQSTACLIRYQQLDVSEMADVDKALKAGDQLFPGTTLGGVFQGAVVLDDASVMALDLSRFTKVLSPKVKGTWNLHVLTRNDPLDFFVSHSSITSVLGNPGQTNYAAGNAFQDAMAFYRRRCFLAGQSISWSALNVGVILESVSGTKRAQAIGMTPLSVSDILECFDMALLSDVPHCTIARINWRQMWKNILRNVEQYANRSNVLTHYLKRYNAVIGSMVRDIVQAKQSDRPKDDEEVDEIKTFIRKVFDENVIGFDEMPDDNVDALDMGADSLNFMSIVNNIRKRFTIPESELQLTAMPKMSVNEVYNVVTKYVKPTMPMSRKTTQNGV